MVACSGVHPDLLTPGLWTDVVPRVDIEGGWLVLCCGTHLERGWGPSVGLSRPASRVSGRRACQSHAGVQRAA